MAYAEHTSQKGKEAEKKTYMYIYYGADSDRWEVMMMTCMDRGLFHR